MGLYTIWYEVFLINIGLSLSILPNLRRLIMTTDYMNQFFTAQKNMFDAWQNTFNPNAGEAKAESRSGAGFMDFSSFQQNTMENFKQLTDFYNNMYKNFTGSPAEILQKMNQSMEVYNNLAKVWESLNAKNFTPDMAGVQKVFEQWSSQYWKFIEDHYIAYLPESLQRTYKQFSEVSESYQTVMKNFFTPWTENSGQFNDLFFKTSSINNFDSFIAVVKLWKENYDRSYKKFLNMPSMGINRELLEKQYDGIDKTVTFMTSYMEFFGQVFKVSQETMFKVITDYSEMLKNGTQPKTMEEFNKYWAREIDKSFDKVYLTDDFSKLMSTVVDSTMQLKKESDKLMEEYMAMLPIPKKSDMDSLHKTVYNLKKEIRTLKKELEKLSAQKNTAQG